MGALALRSCNCGRKLLVYLIGISATLIALCQFWVFASISYFPASSSSVNQVPTMMTVKSKYSLVNSGTSDLLIGAKHNATDLGVDVEYDDNITKDYNSTLAATHFKTEVLLNFSTLKREFGSRSNNSASRSNQLMSKIKKVAEVKAEKGHSNRDSRFISDSTEIQRYVRRIRGVTITLSEMNSMLIKVPASSASVRHRLSARDRQLLSARSQIENAPVLRNVEDLHASVFRNVSIFRRSYDLMEHVFKIYVYKEGEKPIFHQPRLRGLYSAEGWFLKLIERSKHFTVKDPKKAHLYYLPFSSAKLRTTLYEKNANSIKDLEHYLLDYVDLIKKKYRFWNRTGGADHFFVACHDWAPRITGKHMSSCIRALCNANAARGFSIGKDVSVPVTYIHSGNNPLGDIGGKPPSERNILAFFAGQMHGYLRPLLLQYWENKTPDMKIFGPMPRDIDGKAVYREFMKSSKYCICARGYGVHTPRVVESIFYECVPVIISDNYVPPFFEVLDWEAFAVFVQEKDLPNLRDILLSVPEDRYLDMQLRVKMVQQHFMWHKIPEKYDLYHMILHSVWYNRVMQIGQ